MAILRYVPHTWITDFTENQHFFRQINVFISKKINQQSISRKFLKFNENATKKICCEKAVLHYCQPISILIFFFRIETISRSYWSKFFFSYLPARVCFPYLVFSNDFYFLIFTSLFILQKCVCLCLQRNWEILKLSQSLSSRLSNLRHISIAGSFCFIIDAVQKSSNIWWLHLSTNNKIF